MYNEDIGFFKRHRETLWLLVLGIASCSYLALCAVNVYIAFVMLFACIAFYTFSKNIDAAFMLYIIALPFTSIPFLNLLPLGISGMKLLFGLLAALLTLIILYKKPYKVSLAFSISFIILMALYITAWIRSFNYALSAFSAGYVGKLSIARYLIDYVSWTFIIFIPLVAIAYYYREDKDIEKIIKTVSVSAVLLVGYLFVVFISRIGNRGDFEVIRAELGKFTGMHGNDIANFFILSFPVILAWALYKKSRFALFTLLVIVAGTLLSFSRTAYFVVIFGFFLFLFLSGKMKWIPIVALVAGLMINFLLPEIIIERAATGIISGNFDELSAGRIDYIWEPLLNELKTDPQMLLFGSGRFGIISTDAWRQARISLVTHAHNMYLDAVLDVGIIGLAVFLTFFTMVLVYFWRNSIKNKKAFPYYSSLINGCCASVICYMISGLTGRTFFPSLSNIYLWIVVGLGIAICENIRNKKSLNQTPM